MTEKPGALKIFSPSRIALTIIIGLGVATWLVVRNFEIEHFQNIKWTWNSTLMLFVALLMMAIRDLAYMYRIRVLTDQQLSWRHSFDTIMLWEFASAITPSVVGGSGVAVFILNREGIKMGKSTAVVMTTALLDELFYILTVPMIFLLVGYQNLFPVELQKTIFGITLGTKGIFLVGYLFIVLLTSIISYAVFIKPRGFKWVLLQIFRIPILRKWRAAAGSTGDDIIVTSKELRNKPFLFWLKAFGATLFSWTARYWVVNFIILAFVSLGWHDHLMVYARQLVMWVIMLISPTPGSAGVAEIAFSGFLKDFIPLGLAGALALLWRLFSYYPYLFIGAIILPRWIKRTYSSNVKDEN